MQATFVEHLQPTIDHLIRFALFSGRERLQATWSI
jgi:hypothetical protein